LVKLGRHGGALLTSFVFAMVVAHSAAAQTLPSGWASRDVGSPATPGSSQSSGGTYTVQGAGADIGGTSDQFQYCYRSISGDFDIRVRVAAMQDTSAGSKFGLMIRDSMNANARNVFVLLSAEQQLALQWRTKVGRTTGKVTGATAAAPVWIRLVRQGNTFRAYSSPTGSAWSQIGSTNFRMASNAYVGLAVTSHSPYQPTIGTFSGFATGNSAPLVPAPWTAKDIGSPSIAGAASESAGTFTVSGAGTDIFNSSDQFQFVYQPVNGDTQIVARVASLQGANSGSKAGLMIRADLTGSAANAAMFATASGTWVAQERLVAAATTYQAAGGAGAPPGWVKVVREGDVLSAFQSPDGNTWTLVDTDTIPMPSTVYVGLAVTSHTSTAIATAMFTNVTVSVPASSNNPPTVSITAPASGASYTAPASMTISATAADTDGSVARVDFYRGSTLIESDTTSPYSVAWSNVAAGTYSLTAVATDDKGDTTTSMPVSVTVNSTNKPPTVSISAPASGASYTAPASMTIAATAADSDGSVAKVDFYQGSTYIGSDAGSPYSVSWSNVAAGTYSLTAVATDNNGDTTTSVPVSVTVNAPNKPPTVSITSPGSGASYIAPASMSIAAMAGDTDGTVTRVDFYASGQPVGSDTASPFSATWSSVPAGTYSLTAVATDNLGAKTTSAPISVTVTAVAPSPLPTNVVFVPGGDYATNATSVTVELRRSGDAVTVAPVATRNLGKPAVVSGEVTADISTLVDPLASGSYYAIIVTTGAGGSTPSSPSAAFSK
jgi:regulation of enolase protein 1 (concanavalin A-like superfamily)